ncbi:hypothetical protein ApAK_08680 [Thermoplasmatales archaeon AK]|nr:hypothetical protein [Thermoplasmatales archaeon AK]
MTETVSNDRDDPTRNSVWLLQWFQHRIRKNRNVIALFVGDTGSGKSLSAIRLAERVDPSFGVDRVVFTVKDFLALVNSGLSPGSVIVMAGDVPKGLWNAHPGIQVQADPDIHNGAR